VRLAAAAGPNLLMPAGGPAAGVTVGVRRPPPFATIASSDPQDVHHLSTLAVFYSTVSIVCLPARGISVHEKTLQCDVTLSSLTLMSARRILLSNKWPVARDGRQTQTGRDKHTDS